MKQKLWKIALVALLCVCLAFAVACISEQGARQAKVRAMQQLCEEINAMFDIPTRVGYVGDGSTPESVEEMREQMLQVMREQEQGYAYTEQRLCER